MVLKAFNENNNTETMKKTILAALGNMGWLAVGAMSKTSRLQTKRHLSSGRFYSM